MRLLRRIASTYEFCFHEYGIYLIGVGLGASAHECVTTASPTTILKYNLWALIGVHPAGMAALASYAGFRAWNSTTHCLCCGRNKNV